MICDSLALTDRVCLGLTCKRLAFQVSRAPRLPAISTVRDPAYASTSYDGVLEANRLWPLYILYTPEWYTLLPRLAEGWIPKDKYKYCWKCNKIYPRHRCFHDHVLSKTRTLGWLWKVNVPEKQWLRMSSEARREHIVTRWLTEDNSFGERLHQPIVANKFYCPNLGLWANCNADKRGLECPLCLERQLTFGWRWSKALFNHSFSISASLANLTKLARLSFDLGLAAVNTTSRCIRSP